MNIIYKYSDKGKIPAVSNKIIIKYKFNKLFNDGINNIIYFLDNCEPETLKYFADDTIIQTTLGNSGCNKAIYQYIIDNFADDEIVYICEDDYLYDTKNNSKNLTKIICEGLERADYVSLFDHPDKYVTGGDNPFITNGGEDTKVILTNSIHWKFTNSTTMTFACKVKTLKEDFNILNSFNNTVVPQDFMMFLHLGKMGRKLITPIPGLANHCGYSPVTPLFNFE